MDTELRRVASSLCDGLWGGWWAPEWGLAIRARKRWVTGRAGWWRRVNNGSSLARMAAGAQQGGSIGG